VKSDRSGYLPLAAAAWELWNHVTSAVSADRPECLPVEQVPLQERPKCRPAEQGTIEVQSVALSQQWRTSRKIPALPAAST
jgi:hypothetical protein